MRFKAAVLVQTGQPLEVAEISMDRPLEHGQVLVQVLYSGVCGSQLGEIEGRKGVDPFLPHLLGHEAVGVVVEVGPSVKKVLPGETVVMHWMVGSGIQAAVPTFRWKHLRVNSGSVTTFSEYSVVSENRLTKVQTVDDPATLTILGCAATTAYGVVAREGRLALGESIVVLGSGGVGLLVIAAARAAGASNVIALDQTPTRLAQARQMGADAVVNASTSKSIDAVRDLLNGRPPDVVVETTGAKSVIELGFELVESGGRLVLVGVPHHEEKVEIHTLPLHFASSVRGSKGGDSRPDEDIPRLIDLSRRGILPLETMPLTPFPLDEVNLAIDALRSQAVGRVILETSR